MSRFRLSILLLLLLPCMVHSEDPPKDGYTPLFNGKNLDGWEAVGGAMEKWTAEDGVIVCKGAGGGWLFTDKTFEDYELALEYKLPKAGDPGVAIRAPRKRGDPAYHGLKVTLATGALFDLVPSAKEATRPSGQWNQLRVIAQGPKIKVIINGETTAEANLEKYKDRSEARDGKAAHPGVLRIHGHIGLQGEEGVALRNIRIKKL